MRYSTTVNLIKIPLALGILPERETINKISVNQMAAYLIQKKCKSRRNLATEPFCKAMTFLTLSQALNQNVNIISYAESFWLPKLIKEKHTFAAAPFFLCHPQIMIDSGRFTIYIMNLSIGCVVFASCVANTMDGVLHQKENHDVHTLPFYLNELTAIYTYIRTEQEQKQKQKHFHLSFIFLTFFLSLSVYFNDCVFLVCFSTQKAVGHFRTF